MERNCLFLVEMEAAPAANQFEISSVGYAVEFTTAICGNDDISEAFQGLN